MYTLVEFDEEEFYKQQKGLPVKKIQIGHIFFNIFLIKLSQDSSSPIQNIHNKSGMPINGGNIIPITEEA